MVLSAFVLPSAFGLFGKPADAGTAFHLVRIVLVFSEKCLSRDMYMHTA